MKGGCANDYIYIFGFCNISTQRQLVMSSSSSFYGVCISVMHVHLHGANVSGNVLIYQFALTVVIWHYYYF